MPTYTEGLPQQLVALTGCTPLEPAFWCQCKFIYNKDSSNKNGFLKLDSVEHPVLVYILNNRFVLCVVL